MSQINKLIKDRKSVLVFDVDGVLSLMEWGDHNHFVLSDEEWEKKCNESKNPYNETTIIKKMQNFLTTRDMRRVYVITEVGSHNEGEFKREFVNKYYGIPTENVYYVKENKQKTRRLLDIKEKYPNIDDKHIIMVEDTVSILTDIMEHTNFTTVHISSFFDI